MIPTMPPKGKRDPPDLRACLCAISQENWVISIPEGGRVTWVSSKKSKEKPWVNPDFEPESDRAITYRDPVREVLNEQRLGGGRGEVAGFSAKSRLRMLKQMASTDFEKSGLPVFVTLTYGQWQDDWKVWKADLNRFLMALRYKYPKAWGMWKLEFQKRGAPHFHLMLWNGPQVQGFKARYPLGKFRMVPHGVKTCPDNAEAFEFMDKAWGSKHGFTRIEPVATIQGVMAYAGKYMAKVEKAPIGTGRIWGVVNRAGWERSIVETNIYYEEAMRIRRVMRKWSERVNGYKGKNRDRVQGITVFMRAETAKKVKDWALEHRGGCPF